MLFDEFNVLGDVLFVFKQVIIVFLDVKLLVSFEKYKIELVFKVLLFGKLKFIVEDNIFVLDMLNCYIL